MRPSAISPLATFCVCIVAFSLSSVSSMELYSIKYIDRNDSRLVATSNYNYAFTSPKISARDWRAVSVNGDKISILTTAGQYIMKNKGEVDADQEFIEKIRDEIASDSDGHGITQYSSMSGGPSRGSVVVTSGSSSGQVSTSYSSSGFSSTNIGNGVDDTTINYKDENNFSVSKSGLPFNWCRLFYNGDLVTLVYKNGDVIMKLMASLNPEELAVVQKLKSEACDIQRVQAKQFSDTMRSSMESVSKALSNVMANLPKTYQATRPTDFGPYTNPIASADWPFGPSKNPFAAPGWPFGSGNSAGNNGGVFTYVV